MLRIAPLDPPYLFALACRLDGDASQRRGILGHPREAGGKHRVAEDESQLVAVLDQPAGQRNPYFGTTLGVRVPYARAPLQTDEPYLAHCLKGGLQITICLKVTSRFHVGQVYNLPFSGRLEICPTGLTADRIVRLLVSLAASR